MTRQHQISLTPGAGGASFTWWLSVFEFCQSNDNQCIHWPHQTWRHTRLVLAIRHFVAGPRLWNSFISTNQNLMYCNSVECYVFVQRSRFLIFRFQRYLVTAGTYKKCAYLLTLHIITKMTELKVWFLLVIWSHDDIQW